MLLDYNTSDSKRQISTTTNCICACIKLACMSAQLSNAEKYTLLLVEHTGAPAQLQTSGASQQTFKPLYTSSNMAFMRAEALMMDGLPCLECRNRSCKLQAAEPTPKAAMVSERLVEMVSGSLVALVITQPKPWST
jgi:hypothetical protein